MGRRYQYQYALLSVFSFALPFQSPPLRIVTVVAALLSLLSDAFNRRELTWLPPYRQMNLVGMSCGVGACW